jgi:hypothetical protein
MNNKLLVKIITILCLDVLIVGVLFAWNAPATRYEASIYTSTPLIFWLAVGVNLFCGVVFIVRQFSMADSKTSSDFPVMTFLPILFSFAAILSLFIIRGYYFWSGGDPFSHMGYIQNIIQTSHIDNENFYPVLHIYLAQLFKVADISLITLSKVIPLIFALLSVPFTYIFARTILKEKGQIILVTIISMTFLGGWFVSLTPNCLANLALPVALFLGTKCFTSDLLQWKGLFIITVFLFVVFHPLPSLFLLLFLVTIPLGRRIYLRLNNTIPLPNGNRTFSLKTGIVALFITWAVTWITSFAVFHDQIKLTLAALTGAGQTNIGSLLTQIDYASGHNYSVLEMFAKTYGGLLILCILTIAALFVIFRKKSLYYLPLAVFVGPLASLTVLLGLLYLTASYFGPNRLLIYIFIVLSLFSAFTLFTLSNIKHDRYSRMKLNVISGIVSVVILVLFVLGAGKLYPSPYILSDNYQITFSDTVGMNWVLRNDDSVKSMIYLSVPIFRFAEMLLTPEEISKRIDVNEFHYDYIEKLKLPYHFGYDNSVNLGIYFVNNLYLVIDQKDRSLYRDVYPELAKFRFEEQDFIRLESDNSIDRIYGNGNLVLYNIRGLANNTP